MGERETERETQTGRDKERDKDRQTVKGGTQRAREIDEKNVIPKSLL